MHENMTRNFGWSFLDMGRRIERAQNLERSDPHACSFRFPSPRKTRAACCCCWNSPTASSPIARAIGSIPMLPLVLDLLLLDETNPRSLAYQLSAIARPSRTASRYAPSGRGLPEDRRLILALLTSIRMADVEAIVERRKRHDARTASDGAARHAARAFQRNHAALLQRYGRSAPPGAHEGRTLAMIFDITHKTHYRYRSMVVQSSAPCAYGAAHAAGADRSPSQPDGRARARSRQDGVDAFGNIDDHSRYRVASTKNSCCIARSTVEKLRAAAVESRSQRRPGISLDDRLFGNAGSERDVRRSDVSLRLAPDVADAGDRRLRRAVVRAGPAGARCGDGFRHADLQGFQIRSARNRRLDAVDAGLLDASAASARISPTLALACFRRFAFPRATSAAISTRGRRRDARSCKAPTHRTPGFPSGRRNTAGSISIRPTASSFATST